MAIVDDDASVRRALARLLYAASFEVRTYASSTEFLESLNALKPDCILLDLHMPLVNGLDVQRRLASMSPRTPVIVITGHDSAKARAESAELGAHAYFSKPIDANDLIAAIRKTAVRARV